MSAFKESAEYKIGRVGEKLVMDKLKACGWYVVPTCDIDGGETKAPALLGAEGFIVIPDLDTARRGDRRWVEVKTKTEPAAFIKWGGRHVHGIALRHWDAYKKVQEITGAKVWLFVYERKRNNILSAPIDRLGLPGFYRTYCGENEMDRGGNIFFDRRVFQLFGIPGAPGEMWEMLDGRWAVNKAVGRV
jgi:hypothetical protein